MTCWACLGQKPNLKCCFWVWHFGPDDPAIFWDTRHRDLWLLWCVSCRARRPIPPCYAAPPHNVLVAHIMKTDSRKCETTIIISILMMRMLILVILINLKKKIWEIILRPECGAGNCLNGAWTNQCSAFLLLPSLTLILRSKLEPTFKNCLWGWSFNITWPKYFISWRLSSQ